MCVNVTRLRHQTRLDVWREKCTNVMWLCTEINTLLVACFVIEYQVRKYFVQLDSLYKTD